MKSLSTPPWGLIFGAIGIFSFSITLPMTVMALESLPPLFLGAGRACVAAAIAAVVLIATKTRRPTRNQWLHLAVVALGVVVGFPFLTSFALQYVPSAHGAVVIGLLPAATAVAAVIRGKERPSPLFWVASLSGALAVGVFSVVTSGAFTGPALGDLLLLAAVVMAAIGYAEGYAAGIEQVREVLTSRGLQLGGSLAAYDCEFVCVHFNYVCVCVCVCLCWKF